MNADEPSQTPATGAPPSDQVAIASTPDVAALDAPRATWSTRVPSAVWCQDDWMPHLARVAPGLAPPDAARIADEGTGAQENTAEWRLILGLRRGRLHAHRGDYREDAGSVCTFGASWCAAVADGAGSAPWSRLGAAIATHVVSSTVKAALENNASTTALSDGMMLGAHAVSDALRTFAGLTGLALRDLRTTLLVAAVHNSQLALLQVGDGAIAVLEEDGAISLPQLGDAGEFSGEVSHFLPDDGAVERLVSSLVVRPVAKVRAILVASDGIEDPWYPLARHAAALLNQLHSGVDDHNADAAGVLQRVRGPVLGAVDPVSALLAWMTFEKRGENDDRTLFVATLERPRWASSRSA